MAIEIDKDWRKKEESLQDIIKKYRDLPPIGIIEIDVHRRGVSYTDKALEKINPSIHQLVLSKNKDGVSVWCQNH